MFVSHWTNIPSIIFIHKLLSLQGKRQNLWRPRYWPLAPPRAWNLSMKATAAGLTEVKPQVKDQLTIINRAQESHMAKILPWKISKSLKSADREIYIRRSWLLNSPAGLIEIRPHILKYQLATINSLEILHNVPWSKILTLIIWPKFEVSGPWNIGQEVMALVYSCWSHRDTSSYEISTYH